MKPMNPIRAIIPAAGKGTRLHCTDMPKAMYRVGGKPLLEIVLEQTDFIKKEDTYLVVGYQKEKIIDYFGGPYHYVVQNEQLGTGHAVMVCADQFRDFSGTVLVTFGDMPLFRKEMMKKMCEQHEKNGAACTLLTAENPALDDWAKIIRDDGGRFRAIVEGRDCVGEQKNIQELFAGVLVFDSQALFATLPKITTNNVQKEYYLTEVPELMSQEGLLVETFMTDDPDDLRGINRPEDVPFCEAVLKKRGM